VTIDNVVVDDFGNNGGSAGSGIIVYASSDPDVRDVRITNCDVNGDVATSTDTNGVLIADGLYCIMHNNIAKNIVSFAHEYKNDSRFSIASNLIAYNAEFALGYGQTTVGDDGADFIAASNIVGHGCDQGIIVGEGDYNVFCNYTGDSSDSPGTDIYTVHISTDADSNVVWNALSYGSNMDYPVYIRGDRNFVGIASHDSASDVVTLSSGAAKNISFIQHPGARTSLIDAINDASGNSIRGVNANPVFSPGTGEWIGSISGKFRLKLGDSGNTPLSTQEFVFENEDDAVIALAVDASSASTAGVQLNKGTTSNFAGFYYVFASDYWLLRVNNTSVARFSASAYLPETDNAITLGSAAKRFVKLFAVSGTIDTSDEREKTAIRDLSKAEIDAAGDLAKSIGFYKLLSEKDGPEHCGVIAQTVIRIMERHGLDAMAYGLIDHERWEADETGPGGDRYGVRYGELSMFCVRGLEDRLARLEAQDGGT
jgi:hypothetical protein